MPPVVPPIKCQGIKTKLVRAIRSLAPAVIEGRWIEPFCGSCVVAFNVGPQRALLADTNEHIIRFYTDIQSGALTPATVKTFLRDAGSRLQKEGESYYYDVRERFNRAPDSHMFLFLNRSCFNGVMRFNRKGGFNVPFCRKPERFSRAYITKIANQVRFCAAVMAERDWAFRVGDFRTTLPEASPMDFVYADPPYAGRHVDYYNTWTDTDEAQLTAILKAIPCQFVLSTWFGNKFRENPTISENWNRPGFCINKREHFYHVGSSEDLRHAMMEALITNYEAKLHELPRPHTVQRALFDHLP